MPSFTNDQPKEGDTILHCGHLGRSRRRCMAHPAHWFKYEGTVRFERPDGTRGEAEWFAVCEPCFVKHGDKVPVRGDGQWTGEAPAIEKMEN